MTVFTGGPAESPGFLLWRVTLRWQRLVAEALRPLGLTHVQFVVLASTWWLGQGERAPNQIAIAAHANTNISMTSEVLRKLEDKNLVIQTVDPRDRRARVIVVTDEGVRLAEQAVAVVEKADQEFFGEVPRSFVAALQSLADFVPGSATPENPDA